MSIDPLNLLTILLMGLATYTTRVAGLFIAEKLPRTGAARHALEALPPAVLTAVIAPAVLSGPAEMMAGAVTILAAFRLPLIAVVVLGVATTALLRAFLGG